MALIKIVSEKVGEVGSTGLEVEQAFNSNVDEIAMGLNPIFKTSSPTNLERSIIPFVKSIIIRGSNDPFKLTCLINSVEFPYRAILVNTLTSDIYNIDFGSNIPTKKINAGSATIEISVDWAGLGSLEFNTSLSTLVCSPKCYQNVMASKDLAVVTGGSTKTIQQLVDEKYFELFEPTTFSESDLLIVPAIKNIVIRGISETLKLIAVLNSVEYPYRVVVSNSSGTLSVLDFAGANSKSALYLTGSIEVTVDWTTLGSYYLNKNFASSSFVIAKKCYNANVIYNELSPVVKAYVDTNSIATTAINVAIGATPDNYYGKIAGVSNFTQSNAVEGEFSFTKITAGAYNYVRLLEKFAAKLDNTKDCYISFDYISDNSLLLIGHIMPSDIYEGTTYTLPATSVWKRFKQKLAFTGNWVNGTSYYADYFQMAGTNFKIKNIRSWSGDSNFDVADNERAFGLKKRVETLESTGIVQIGKLEGLDIWTLGDSITYMGNSWAFQIGAKLKANIINLGRGGATWADRTSQIDYDASSPLWTNALATLTSGYTRYFAGNADLSTNALPTDNASYTSISNEIRWMKRLIDNYSFPTPEVIVISCGINDTKSSTTAYSDLAFQAIIDTPLASMTTAQKTKLEGGLRFNIETIMTLYPNAQIYIASPVRTNYGYLRPYTLNTWSWIKKFANYYNCKFIDAYDESGITEPFELGYSDMSYNVANSGRYLYDGLHPNSGGQKLMTEYFYNEIINKYHSKV